MAIHWSLPDGPALCGSTEHMRWTAVRLVSCQYCQNILDRFICDRLPELLASTQKPTPAPEGGE